jgi:hypothetical protein
MPGISSSHAPFDESGFDMHTRDIERLWLKVDEISTRPTTFAPEDSVAPALPAFDYEFSGGTVTTVPYEDPATVTVTQTGASVTFDFEIPSGPAGTVAVGTVTTVDYPGPAVVTNTGTTTAAVLDFTLPRGPTGPQGPEGVIPTGPEGEPMDIVTVQACVNGVTRTLYIYAYIVS